MRTLRASCKNACSNSADMCTFRTSNAQQAIAELRALLTNLPRGYISIWQLAVLGGVLQGLLCYGSQTPLFEGLKHNIRTFNLVAASFAFVREFAPLTLVRCLCKK